jgi:hypothetical protein
VRELTTGVGLSTRNISEITFGLSTDRLITQLLITTSTDPSGSGVSSIMPLRTRRWWRPGHCLEASWKYLVGYFDAAGEPRLADSTGRGSMSIPPPELRSSTFSPCRSSATQWGTARVIDPKDLVTRWTSPRIRGAKSDLESAQNVLILKWLPHDL